MKKKELSSNQLRTIKNLALRIAGYKELEAELYSDEALDRAMQRIYQAVDEVRPIELKNAILEQLYGQHWSDHSEYFSTLLLTLMQDKRIYKEVGGI